MTSNEAVEMIAATRSRAVAAGIDVYEYDAVTARIENLDDWSDLFRGAGTGHESAGAKACEEGRLASARQSYLAAAAWYYFAGAWPSPRVSTYQESARAQWTAIQLFEPNARRLTGDKFAGVLRVPGVHPDGGPLVVLVPGLDGAKEEFFTITEELLARGCATFVLDGPGQGELVGTVPPTSEYPAVVGAALDLLESIPDWKPESVGILGCSLGGFYTAATLAREPRLRAGVIVSGLVRGPSWEGLPPHIQGLLRVRTTDEEQGREFIASLDASEGVPSISVPVFIVDGDADPLVNGDYTGAWIAEHAQVAERRVIAGGDHNVANARWKWLPDVADWLAAQLQASIPATTPQGEEN
ncbi:alpha/beta hydrolase [Streptomyces malaysiensis]|uniref:Alpha/beta fold hydrolase n=1 Tax=Streptomyces malaysiensis subsp. samsunensis TaxID=459658 RepID=A0A9X2RYC7_STRMQ|nr:alpha/beta fold hydrolase [Streptomyces samsunensis]MCQ8835197.1 alpha/beta fold hydrolase [Streptomyces samsunensis]